MIARICKKLNMQNITCSKGESSHWPPLLVKLHQALVKLQIMNDHGPILKSHSHDVYGRGLGQAEDGGTPSSKCVDQFARSNVPELKLSLLATKEYFVQVSAWMDNARDLKRLGIKVDFSIELYRRGEGEREVWGKEVCMYACRIL